jgi:hypothetical protein
MSINSFTGKKSSVKIQSELVVSGLAKPAMFSARCLAEIKRIKGRHSAKQQAENNAEFKE